MRNPIIDSILILVGLFYAVAFALVWMNRGSEKIVATAIPLGVAGILGVLISFFVFGAQQPIAAAFSSSFFSNVESKAPEQLPYRISGQWFGMSYFAACDLFRSRPDLFRDPADPSGVTLYHHLLQRTIIYWLNFRHAGSWETDITPLSLGGIPGQIITPATAMSGPSRIIPPEELRKIMAGNHFASIQVSGPMNLVLPPGTSFVVDPPTRQGSGAEIGKIVMRNGFCTLTIETQSSMWFRGVGGYRRLLRLSDDQESKLATTTYIVRVKTEFNRLRSGHPDMTRYRAWATGITDGIKGEFDEEVIWAKTKEEFIFSKNVGY